MLLELSPSLHRYSTFGGLNSPLHFASAKGHNEIVSLFLDKGAEMNSRNYCGQSNMVTRQQLVNCDTSQNCGCNESLMDYAFEYIKKNGGITADKNYPYLAEQWSCNNSLEKFQVVMTDGYQDENSYL